MKIKVGDWVKWTDEVVKVTHIYGEPNQIWYTIFSNNGTTTVPSEALEKLPISFKPLNIGTKQKCHELRWDSYRKVKGIGNVHLVCIEEHYNIFVGIKIPHESIVVTHVDTIAQARDWLELQYATLLAKARG